MLILNLLAVTVAPANEEPDNHDAPEVPEVETAREVVDVSAGGGRTQGRGHGQARGVSDANVEGGRGRGCGQGRGRGRGANIDIGEAQPAL